MTELKKIVRPRRLRIGVMLDGFTLPAWQYAVLQDVAALPLCEWAGVIHNAAPRPSYTARITKVWPHALYSGYQRLDRFLVDRFVASSQDAFKPKDASLLLRGIATYQVVPQQTKYVDRFLPSDIDALRALDLDVVLRFGFRILRGDVLNLARYGIWSYHHGDLRRYRGGPPMFWEMCEGTPTCGITLQILTEALDGGHVIYRSLGKTNTISLALNRNAGYWKGVPFVSRCLKSLYADEHQYLDRWSHKTQKPYTRGIYRVPGNLKMVQFGMQLAQKAAKRGGQKLLGEEAWFVATRPSGVQKPHHWDSADPKLEFLYPPQGRFYADPALLHHNNITALFFEDYCYAKKRAVISMARREDDQWSAPTTVLDTGSHLSYPAMFSWEGEAFMLPESRATKKVTLYQAQRFPHDWVACAILLDNVEAVDATLLAYDHRWWMFVNIASPGAQSSDELWLFFAPTPKGPFVLHPASPVVSNISHARPAGMPFVYDGRLLRPAQGSEERYGYRVVFREILKLTPTQYVETHWDALEPGWFAGNLGTHTYNQGAGFEVIDGRVWRSTTKPVRALQKILESKR